MEPFLAFFLILYLQKSAKTFEPLRKWNQVFTALLCIIGLVFIVDVIFQVELIKWFWHILLLFIAAATLLLPAFSQVRMITFAILPLVVLDFISDIIEPFKQPVFVTIKTFMVFADPVALTWMIALWVLWNRQRKALEKERAIRQSEEEQHKVTEARKAELELLVSERTMELTKQKEELQNAIAELTTTQKQLIQSEKMASLGELTAGIAHEIQNPLNFVNNFSELNVEMIDEMKEEINKGNYDEVKLIAESLEQNEQKIILHGKRADSIVKGMLLHSRKNTGAKEMTDINALADEYLRLSYHGLRAKNKSFNADFKTDFDASIGKIEVVPQDIGRVFLNLYNNAFFAASLPSPEKNGIDAGRFSKNPTVWVTTKREDDKVVIRVRDNGPGIPQNIVDKIFQPFFTTKPTGQGTGLGLSLSYDIVKAHGGEIKVETKENEGSEFIIQLPRHNNETPAHKNMPV